MEQIKQNERNLYPRGRLYLASKNRITLAGLGFLAAGAFAQRFETAGFREVGIVMLLLGIMSVVGTDFGAGTIKTYRRTIDLYRRNGRMPSKYRVMIITGAYCYEVGYREAQKDINAGKAD